MIWLLNDHMQGYGYDRHKVLKFGKYTVILGEICGVAIENNIVNLLCENDDFWFDGERQFHIGWTYDYLNVLEKAKNLTDKKD